MTIPPNDPPPNGDYNPPPPQGSGGYNPPPPQGGGYNQPPSGYSVPPPAGGYYNAPPPPQSNNSGCLKAAGITCLVLVIMIVIGGVLTYNGVKNMVGNPRSILGQAYSVGMSSKNGILIQQAVVKYHDANRRYPDKLGQLVPQYIPDARTLHADTDPDPNPAHISWTYVRPSEGASPKTPILKLPFKMEIPGANGNATSQSGQIFINLDGTTTSSQNAYGSPPSNIVPIYPQGSQSGQ